jgi:hypothetical protein
VVAGFFEAPVGSGVGHCGWSPGCWRLEQGFVVMRVMRVMRVV